MPLNSNIQGVIFHCINIGNKFCLVESCKLKVESFGTAFAIIN